MTERPTGELEPSAEWKELLEEGVVGAIENYYGVAVEFNPEQLVDTDDERLKGKDLAPYKVNDFSKLSPAEQRFIRDLIYKELQLNPEAAVLVDSQEANPAPDANIPGMRIEEIYKTYRSEDEDLYLHVVKFKETSQVDGYFIASGDFIV